MRKFLGVGLDLSKFIAKSYGIRWSEKDLAKRRHRYLRSMNLTANSLLNRIGVDVRHVNEEVLKTTSSPRLIVCNHMSYLDIPILIQAFPALFVTSVELQQTFFLGDIAEAGGSLFVERRHPSRLKKDILALGSVLREGFDLVVFPEGTSSNGETVKPFRQGLFSVATELQIPIQPLCLKYISIDGENFGPTNRDKICWYGDMKFGAHFWQMHKIKEIKAELHYLEPVLVNKDSDRRALAAESYQKILDCYHSS